MNKSKSRILSLFLSAVSFMGMSGLLQSNSVSGMRNMSMGNPMGNMNMMNMMNMMNNNANMSNMNSNMNNVMNNNDPWGIGYGGFGFANNMNNMNNGMARNMSLGNPMGNMNMMNMMNNGMGFGQSNNMFINNNQKVDNKNNSMKGNVNNNPQVAALVPNIDNPPFKFEDAVNDLLSTRCFNGKLDLDNLKKTKQLSVNINDGLGFKKILVGMFKKSEVSGDVPAHYGNIVFYDILFEADSTSGTKVKISGAFDLDNLKWLSFTGPIYSRSESLIRKFIDILGKKKGLSVERKDALQRDAQCLMSFLNVRFLFPMDKWFDDNGVHNNVKLEMGSWDMKFQRIEVKTISRNSCEVEFHKGIGTSNNSIEFAKVKATLNNGIWNLELEDIR